MDFAELDKWTKALMLKIHTITGWVVPEDDMRKILVDQLRKRILEAYGNCNPDEIEYAFRTFGIKVQDWGKQMNLSLIDQVMTPYLSRRYDVSQHEEILSVRSNALQIEYKEDMSREAMQDWFNDTAKKIRTGQLTVDFVPIMLYEFMDDNGNITATKEEKYMYLQRAADYREWQLQADIEKEDSVATRWRLSSFMTQKNQGYFEGDEATKVKDLAKKILLFELVLNSPS